jgi:hypothetical protein
LNNSTKINCLDLSLLEESTFAADLALNHVQTLLLYVAVLIPTFRLVGVPLGPAEIYNQYTERVDEPRTKRTIRTYLSKMTQYNLLEAEGTSRDRKYTLITNGTSPSTD